MCSQAMHRLAVGGLEEATRSLWLAFQPIVCWSENRIIGHEALARTAVLGPATLFELAKRSGRLTGLSRRIRAHAARAMPRKTDLFLNLHPDDLKDSDLYAQDAPLSAHASRVVLEMTESAPPHDARRCIQRLRELGFRIALDDLGAGHNGLGAIARIHPDVVKLDMFLVRGVERDRTRRGVIRSVVHMCEDLGIALICEGVETRAELETLLELGCDLFQGYLFGRPR